MDGNQFYNHSQDGQYSYTQSQIFGGPHNPPDEDQFVVSPDQSFTSAYRQIGPSYPYPRSAGPSQIHFSDFIRPDAPESSSASRRRTGRWKRCRTGCYTCRRRRVKCDEGKPICKRCKTGNRECLWPDPAPETERSRKGGAAEDEDNSSQGEDEDESQEGSVPPTDVSIVRARKSSTNDSPSTPMLTPNTGTTPLAEGSGVLAPVSSNESADKPMATAPSDFLSRKMARFPQDVQFFLWYARENLSSAHYGFKIERDNFLTNILMRAALDYEPLLYALVGFASYHYTIRKYHGKTAQFLGYYNKSINLLQKSMRKSKNESTPAILLTSLQLATIEEFLGDWETCRRHSVAACSIIQTLYTPQTMVTNTPHRMILQWYMRFNIYLGVMGGQVPILGMDWVQANHDLLAQQAKAHPEDLPLQYEERYARLRILGSKVSSLQGALKQGLFTDVDEFGRQWDALSEEIAAFSDDIDPALIDDSKRIVVDEASYSSPGAPDSRIEKYYDGDIYMTNQLLVDYWVLDVLFNGQLAALSRGQPRSERIYDLADRICRVVDAMPHHPRSPPGVLLAYQTATSVAAANLRQSETAILWSRRTLAEIETQGYIWPEKYRIMLSSLWGIDVTDWWLPDGEMRTPIIQEIRSIHSERQKCNKAPSSQVSEDVINMTGIFRSVNLSDTPSPDRSSSFSTIGGAGSPSRSLARRSTTASDNSMTSSSAAFFGPPSGGSSNMDFEAMLLDDQQHLSEWRWGSSQAQHPWSQN